MRDLGPVLGAYHPVVAYNVARLTQISGLDEVSFHMSGTEAVMQAVRLAQYHTRRTHLVRFCGAYHGWWGDVQPGVGNPIPARETYTLKEMSEDTLRAAHAARHRLRAGQSAAGAAPQRVGAGRSPRRWSTARAPPTSTGRPTRPGLRTCARYAMRAASCLFSTEAFVGFRLAPGGAQEYFGVRADSRHLRQDAGGGLPVGVVCGRKHLMKRYRDNRPVDVCFARGTFNSHPYVMGAMCEFLQRLEDLGLRALYDNLDEVWNERAQGLNQRLRDEGLPVQVANLSSIWTVTYTQPSRYNWMLQYYMRAEGLALSWVALAA